MYYSFDDISSSGTTFESAAAVIRQYCKQVEMISAVTLFAPYKIVLSND